VAILAKVGLPIGVDSGSQLLKRHHCYGGGTLVAILAVHQKLDFGPVFGAIHGWLTIFSSNPLKQGCSMFFLLNKLGIT